MRISDMDLLAWTPDIGVGPFLFRESELEIIKILEKFDLKYEEVSLDYEARCLEVDTSRVKFRLYFEENIFDMIEVDEEIYYNGKNLIGMHIDDVIELFGVKYDSCENKFDAVYDYYNIYYFDSMGLNLWTTLAGYTDNLGVTPVYADDE